MIGRHEIVIGSPRLYGCWVVVRKSNDFISEASDSYLVHLEDFHIEAKVAKNTKEGGELGEFLASSDRDNDAKLVNLCWSLFCRYVSPAKLKNVMEQKYEEGITEGRNQMRKHFMSLLELE